MPDFDDKEALALWIDSNICANFPILSPDLSNEDKLYCNLVEKYMIHTCSSELQIAVWMKKKNAQSTLVQYSSKQYNF